MDKNCLLPLHDMNLSISIKNTQIQVMHKYICSLFVVQTYGVLDRKKQWVLSYGTQKHFHIARSKAERTHRMRDLSFVVVGRTRSGGW